MSKPVYTSFNLILHKNDYTCNLEGKCIQKAESTLLFCSAPEKCQLLTTKKVLYKNLRFSLLQTITEPGFESFYLLPFSVIYIGVDLERNANILSTNRV